MADDIEPLLEGENPDLYEEAATIFGPAWMDTCHHLLGGMTPREIINLGSGEAIRDLCRMARFGGFT